MDKVKGLNSEVVDFGCRLNIYEGEVIKAHLLEHSIENAVVFNSCAVTAEAERKLKQSIRSYRKQYPDKRIIVTGCAAQLNPKVYSEMEGVDCVLGNKEKIESDTYKNIAYQLDNGEALPEVIVNDIMSLKETASHMVESFDGKSRAFVQIQNGCNHRCTFCIIPYARGNNRSVPIGDIVNSVQTLVDNGYKEVVLTGVDITDYGLDLPFTPTLGQMIKRLLKNVPKLQRLRLSSLDVAEIDDDLRDLIRDEDRLMSHFHISLQSGDDMILKRMKRRHSRNQVIDFVNFVRDYRINASFGADIIVGFPTETDEMFENSMRLVCEAGLVHLHVFPYSSREGTPASRIPQHRHVTKSIKKERCALLRELGVSQVNDYLQRFLNKEVRGIVESENFAKSDEFVKIKIAEGAAKDIGNVKLFKIKHIENNILYSY